jgi:replicative DNA helicase
MDPNETFDPFQTGQIDLMYSQARDVLEKGLEEILDYGTNLLKERRYDELKSFITEKTRGLSRERDVRELRPYSLVDLGEDIACNREGLKTGWPAVDKHLRIPQEALTIIAGQPSHGKTTVLMNLFLNCVEQYPEQQFLFYSYEENSKHLALKSIMNLSEYCIDEGSNFSQFEQIMKSGDKSIPQVNAAIEKLQNLTQSRRMWLLDHGPDLEDLNNELNYLCNEHNIGGIFVDYVQKMKIKDSLNDRHKDMQIISNELLRMAKSYKIPIVLGAQLEKSKELTEKVKLDQLRDAGDIEQDANLIIGVYNKSMIKARSGVKIDDRLIDLTLSILKNRNGSVNTDVVLRFDRPILKIRDFSTATVNNSGPKLTRL